MSIDVGVGYIPILPDMAGFEEKVAASAEKASKSSKIRNAGKTLGLSFVAGAAAVTTIGVERLFAGEKVDKQIKAREKSTRESAGVTALHIDKLSSRLLNLTGVDNEATKSSAALLLSFKAIKDQGVDKTFDQTQLAILNVATAMNNGVIPSAEQLKATTIQVAKAVNDPIKGMTALRRVGVSFNETQEETVKKMVEGGHTFAAQKIILHELNTEFAGSAKAAGSSLQGQLDKTKVKFQNLAAELVKGLLPVFSGVINIADKVVSFFEQHKDFAKVFLAGLAAVGTALLIAFGGPVTAAIAAISALVIGFSTFYEHSETFRNIIQKVGDTLSTAFKTSLPWIKNALHNVVEALKDAAHWTVTAFGNVKTTIQGVIKSFKDFWNQSVIVRTTVKTIYTVAKTYLMLVAGVFKVAFEQAWAIVKRVLPAIEQIVRGFGQVIKGIVEVVSGILTLNFGRAWTGVKRIFSGAISVLLGYLRGITAPARQIIGDIGDALTTAFEKVWHGITGVFEDGVNAVGGFLQDLANIINPLLSAIGVGEIHITGSVEPESTSKGGLGKHRGANSYGHKPKKAAGGAVAVPGRGNQDTVPLAVNGAVSAVVAPGELIHVSNAQQQQMLSNAVSLTYGVSGLGDFYNTYNRPHFMGSGLPGFSEGFLGTGVGPSLGEVANVVDAPVRIPAEEGIKLFNTAKNAAEFISGLPGVPSGLSPLFGEIASGVLGKVKDWVSSIPNSIFGGNSSANVSSGLSGSRFKIGAEELKRIGAPSNIALALFEALVDEAGPDSNVLEGEGSGAGAPIMSAAREISGFLTGNPRWTGTAAMSLANSGEAAYEIAQDVQASGAGKASHGRDNYGSHQKEAESLLKQYGVAGFAAGGFPKLGRLVQARHLSSDGAGGPATASSVIAWAKHHLGNGDKWGYPGEWCGAFTGADMQAHGITPPSDYPSAASWASWGTSDASPKAGDVVVIGGSGHVGIALGGNMMISGNYSDSVAETTIGDAAGGRPITGYRTPPYSGSSTASTKANTAHSYKEAIPAQFAGAQTGHLSFGSMPKSLKGVEKELRERRTQLHVYRAAERHAKAKHRPGIEHAIAVNIAAIEGRISELRKERAKYRREIAEHKVSTKLGKSLSKLAGYGEGIGAKVRAYNSASQLAEQIVGLEPTEPQLGRNATQTEREAAEQAYDDRFNSYITNRERPAYLSVLGAEADWRNEILSAQSFAGGDWQHEKRVGGLEGHLEDKIIAVDNQIAHIESLKPPHGTKGHPVDPKAIKHYHKQLAKLPLLHFQDKETRKALGEARGEFYPGGARITENPAASYPGSGTLEEALINVQGIHWPGFHEKIKNLPQVRKAGSFGGLIWNTQEQLEALVPLNFEAGEAESSGGAGGETGNGTDNSGSELASALEAALVKSNAALAVKGIDDTILGELGRSRQVLPFGGVFHSGGIIPGNPGQEVAAILEAGETVTPVGGAPSFNIHTHVHDGAVNSDRIETVVEEVQTATASKARRRF